jgi:succinate dehydrogenase (ubiquinone) membrane anchor subunit
MIFNLHLCPWTAAETKEVSKMAGSYHWQFERLISLAILPVCAVPVFTGPSKVADFLLTFLLPLHCHLGFDQIITDYLNKRKIGAAGNMAVKGLLLACSVLTAAGLYSFNTNDVGITEFVARLWNPKKEEKK